MIFDFEEAQPNLRGKLACLHPLQHGTDDIRHLLYVVIHLINQAQRLREIGFLCAAVLVCCLCCIRIRVVLILISF
jgi:hypothetical protein